MFKQIIKKLFFIFIIRPFFLIITGVRVKGIDNLPTDGAAILIANHNSHLDTLLIMSLFKTKHITKVRPVGASEYFFRNKFTSILSKKLIDIIPLSRNKRQKPKQLFKNIFKALDDNKIIIFFPEGSRGNPEEMKHFAMGITHIAELYPNAPVIPIFINQAGKSLPKGEALFVPFIINISIGKKVSYIENNKKDYITKLENSVKELQENN